ncbi:MAG: hypothetical protein PHP32_01640, partial [Candidatus Izemoplasmatales bacterium]|nr:hypothetical protein [Candidatus Izemoplasmatales bacterium]
MNKAWRIFFLILFLSIFSVSCSLIPDKDFSEGRGTEESPYIISNWEEFQKVTNSTPKYYKLAQDIEFVGEPLSAPLGIFYGHLDGNGKSITNLKIIIDEWTSAAGEKVGNMGLFSEMAKGSSIDDIRIEDAELLVSYAGEATVGMLVGEKDPNSILTNVFVSGFISVIARDGRVGGIVGKGTNFTNLTSDIFLDVISSDYDVNAGGIAGSIVGGEVDRLRSSGEIHIGGGDTLLHDKYAHAVGGIVGYLTGSMTHALSDVDLYCNVEQYDNNIGFYAGGLVGSLADESISQSLSMGTIVSDLSNITYLGGAVGYVSSGYVLNVLAVSPIITYGTEELDDVIGGVLGKANSDSDARNVYYVNDLGFESAVAKFEDNPLYHNSVTTFELRTLTSIPNFDDTWDFSGVSYPTLNIGNLPIKGNI